MRLEVQVGFATEQGSRLRNEDYTGVLLGNREQRVRFGVLAALADGVGGAKGGRVAAELAVRGAIEAYFGQSETLGVKRNLTSAIEQMNGWIHAMGHADPELTGMATTFTALVLRGRQAHFAHVGDSRLYRLREDALVQLTEDHAPTRGAMRNRLTRAIGIGDTVRIDYGQEEARLYDRYMLCSDGVHGGLSDGVLRAILGQRNSPDEAARLLVDAALDARIGDNATALVVDVLSLPAANMTDLETAIAALPILPAPRVDTVVDGYRLDRMLADGRYSRVFRGTDENASRSVIMKFPKPAVGADALLRQAFLRESWIAAKVRSPWVGEVLDPGPTRRTRLYTVMPYYDGETLEQRLSHPPRLTLGEGLDIAVKLAKAVAALHRNGIVHRDVKPDNVVLQPGGTLKLIDLGVARLPFMEDEPAAETPGTPSYMAPELFTGQPGDVGTDQFALGVTIFRMFTSAYPYGEIEPFTRPRFGRAASLQAQRPDLPSWLDQTLARALAVRPEERFEDVIEFGFELEHGAIRAAPAPPRRRPLYGRDPLRFWQAVAAILALLLGGSLALGQSPGGPMELSAQPTHLPDNSH